MGSDKISSSQSLESSFQSSCSSKVDSLTSPYFRGNKEIIKDFNNDMRQPKYRRQDYSKNNITFQSTQRESINSISLNKMDKKKRIKSKNLVVSSDLLLPFEF